MASVEHIVRGTREEWLAERRKDVTASDVAALYGVHHFKTAYGLSREKRGISDLTEVENSYMKRGLALEPIAISMFAANHPTWKVWPAEEYLRDATAHLGATPDAFCTTDDDKSVVVEAKVVAGHELKRRWSEASPPEAILLQVLTQLALTDFDYGIVAALDIDRWAMHEYRVDRFPELEADIRSRAQKFMEEVAAGHEPGPDFARDGQLIAARYLHGGERKEIDLRHDNRVGELCAAYIKSTKAAKILNKEREAIAAELQNKIEGADVALVPGFTVKNTLVFRKAHMVRDSEFRRLSVISDSDEGDDE